MKRLFALCWMILALPSLAAQDSKLDVTYSVTRAGEPLGEIKESLAITDGQYRLQSVSTPTGVAAIFLKETFTHISAGRFDKTGFRPEQYRYLRSAKPKKNLDARFDWEAKTAQFNFDGKTETQPAPETLQDRLSLGYQLRYLPRDQDKLRVPVTNGKTIHEYDLRRLGEETLRVPAGSFRVTRYARERTPEHDGITVWVSEKIAAPIKIVVDEKKGAQNEQVLTSISNE